MLLHDIKLSENWPGELRIIGTDLNEAALAQASTAKYAEKQLLAMPQAFRGRYMTSAAGHGHVVPEIQSLCRFEVGDVCVKHPAEPLALISCRNLLIYLKTMRQETLLRRLYDQLCDDGLLFLGQAESLAPGSRVLFASLDADHRIYRKRTQPA
jgi:chemotaxis methyl-accepting protein methylase